MKRLLYKMEILSNLKPFDLEKTHKDSISFLFEPTVHLKNNFVCLFTTYYRFCLSYIYGIAFDRYEEYLHHL